jgi:hypothetical protein
LRCLKEVSRPLESEVEERKTGIVDYQTFIVYCQKPLLGTTQLSEHALREWRKGLNLVAPDRLSPGEMTLSQHSVWHIT